MIFRVLRNSVNRLPFDSSYSCPIYIHVSADERNDVFFWALLAYKRSQLNHQLSYQLKSNPRSLACVSHCCLKNAPVLSSDCGSGFIDELGGLKAYISGPSDSKRAILLLSDVFGYEAPNLRKLADKIATQGFLVVVPDFLYGDPANCDDPAFDFQAWRQLHSPEKACEDAKLVIDALKIRNITSLGVAGLCFGGSAAIKLAKLDAIKAAVALHPSDQLTLDEVNEVIVPTAFLGAENDQVSPPDQLKQFGDILSAKPGINSMVKIFPGVSHGFGLRYDVEDEAAVKKADEAQAFMINWLAVHVN